VGTSGDDSLSGTRFTALLWMEAFKGVLVLVPVIYALAFMIFVGNHSNEGFGGLFLEVMFMLLVAPVLVILGKIHLKAAWLLFGCRVPSRAPIVTATAVEGGVGLCVLMLGFSPTVAVWTLFCGVELFTVLSRTANDYWSSGCSPSSASSTSG
jgi:hypothetical protein